MQGQKEQDGAFHVRKLLHTTVEYEAYNRWTNLEKKHLADSVAIYGQGRELFRPPTNKDHLKDLGTDGRTT